MCVFVCFVGISIHYCDVTAVLHLVHSPTLLVVYFFSQGFLDLRLKPWIRNFLTRCLAIIPSLIVAIIGGSAGAGKLIIIASVIFL